MRCNLDQQEVLGQTETFRLMDSAKDVSLQPANLRSCRLWCSVCGGSGQWSAAGSFNDRFHPLDYSRMKVFWVNDNRFKNIENGPPSFSSQLSLPTGSHSWLSRHQLMTLSFRTKHWASPSESSWWKHRSCSNGNEAIRLSSWTQLRRETKQSFRCTWWQSRGRRKEGPPLTRSYLPAG